VLNFSEFTVDNIKFEMKAVCTRYAAEVIKLEKYAPGLHDIC
jgi:hypothetical protein